MIYFFAIILIILAEIILGIRKRKSFFGKILILIFLTQFIFIPVMLYLVYSFTDYYNQKVGGIYPLPWEFLLAEIALLLFGLFFSIAIIIDILAKRNKQDSNKIGA